MRWLFGLLLVIGLACEANAAQITLTWKDNSSNEKGFNVQKKAAESDPITAYKFIATTAANVTTFTDSTVVAGDIPCYRINAFNDSGVSAWSPEACLLATPTGIVMTYTP